MLDGRTASLGTLVLRGALVVMSFVHSLVVKYLELSMPSTAEYVRSMGDLGLSAYATFVSESVAGALLIVGVWSRVGALAFIPVLVRALTVHASNGWVFSALNGRWACPVFLIALSTVLAFLGNRASSLKTPPLSRRPRYA